MVVAASAPPAYLMTQLTSRLVALLEGGAVEKGAMSPSQVNSHCQLPHKHSQAVHKTADGPCMLFTGTRMLHTSARHSYISPYKLVHTHPTQLHQPTA